MNNLFSLTLLLFISSFFCVQAQDVMLIEKNDHTTIEVKVSDISQITFHTIYLTCPDSNHPHVIDLGLPSGTKWSCCNVGADSPDENGNYYAWGETEVKSAYVANNYVYSHWTENSYGIPVQIFDDIGDEIAGTQYDAARANWGGSWRMPSLQQFKELMECCTYTPTTQLGTKGFLLTGPNGATIFLPSAGYRFAMETYSGCRYWSSTLDQEKNNAYRLNIYNQNWDCDSNKRYYGLPVRPVCP